MTDCIRKILLWDIAQNKTCWAYGISQVVKDTNYEDSYRNLETVHESSVCANVHEKKCNDW